MNIIEAIRLQSAFGGYFEDLGTWGAWMSYLRALFALKPEAGDLELLKECTGLRSWPETAARESYVIVSRRGGKTSIAALLAAYMALFKDWSKYLSKGEKGSIFLLAVSKAQAQILKNRIEGFLNLNHAGAIKKMMQEEIELDNGISIVIKPGSFRSLRGYTVVCAILEELSFWRYEIEAANQDIEVLRALKPAMGTVKGSLLVGISSPYGKGGLMYEKYQKWHGKPGGPLVWKAGTRIMNPTFSKLEIDQAIEEDPAAAAAEYLGDFRPDQSSFCDPDVVDGAVIPGRFELPFKSSNEYQGFVDPSGGKSDSFTMSIAHRDGNRILLDLIREMFPPFSPDSAVEDFSRELKKYKISTVQTDRYAGEWVAESFRKYGIGIEYSERPKAEIYLEFLPLLNNGTVELLDHGRMIGQLKNLDRRTRAGGRDLVDVFSGHDDIINAAAGAVIMSQSPGEEGEVYSPGDYIESKPPEPGQEDDLEGDFDIGWVGDEAQESDLGGVGMERSIGPEERYWNAQLDEWRGGGGQRGAPEHYALGQQIRDLIENKTIFYEADIPKMAGQLTAQKDAVYKAVGICIVEFWLSVFGYIEKKALGSWEISEPIRKLPGILSPEEREAARIVELTKKRDLAYESFSEIELASAASLTGLLDTTDMTRDQIIIYLKSQPFEEN